MELKVSSGDDMVATGRRQAHRTVANHTLQGTERWYGLGRAPGGTWPAPLVQVVLSAQCSGLLVSTFFWRFFFRKVKSRRKRCAEGTTQ